ncbi:unnamed protein product [Durusdinium trenchii]|uniref:Ubiquitin-like domain-containing protein n=1 Tax=Durusdinium trenchii TaxID=1381693 RepID=A0ABP0M151_9DINO
MWPGRLAWLALNASDQWTSLFNGSYFRRLDCEDDRRWSSFRRQLETLLAKGRLVGEDVALQATAEELLTPWDEKPRDVFQAATEAFRARLLAATAPSAPRTTSRMGLCFPGYQAACWVRILGLHTTLAQGAREDAQELEIMIETNAQHCSSIFGKEASLEYLSSTSWPVRLLDLELFMRSCPDAAFGMRRMRTLPVEIQTFEHFRQLLRRPAVESSAPRRFTPSSGDGGLAPWSPTLRVTSVFGGHCSLWLETLYTLWSLFADLIDPFLVTYNHEDGCLERFGLRDVLPHAPVLGDEEQGSRGSVDQMLRSSDLLVCMWVSECSRLRAHYSKPVIFYSGFLLLNDQSFHPGHAWSEALFHFWQRLSDLFACDVLAAKDGTPVVGPPCLVLFEERPLAEVAYWQTGQRKPVVRPLSLYVRCLHDPENAKQEVLIIHRGRLTSDGTEAKALNAMKHAFYPYSFVDQEDGMPFASMAEFRSVVLLPWDLNLVMFLGQFLRCLDVQRLKSNAEHAKAEAESPSRVSINVLLPSGRSETVTLPSTSKLLELKLAAQKALQQGFLRLLSRDGHFLDLTESLESAGLQDGDDVSAIASIAHVARTPWAFALWCRGGQVVTWGDALHGGDSEAVQRDLRDVIDIQATNAAFAATLANGRVVTWGDRGFGGDCHHLQEELQNVQQIAAAHNGAFAALLGGRVVAWGHAQEGERGFWSKIYPDNRHLQRIWHIFEADQCEV